MSETGPGIEPEAELLRHLFERLGSEAEALERGIRDLRVASGVRPDAVRRHLEERYDFTRQVPVDELLDDVVAMLRRWSVHVTHPRYFGLFNPSVRPVAVAADALVALFNPQLAAWSHAPAINEIERHVTRFCCRRLGFEVPADDGSEPAGHFTAGGQEANHTALLAALAHHFPEITERGVRGLDGQPVLYVSDQGHHSIEKATVAAGLGRDAMRTVATGEDFRMDPGALAEQIARDRSVGLLPFLVVATAGSTATGSIDPLTELGEVCRREGLWFHVDAAWGGSFLLSKCLAPVLDGIARADSVTWDAHKGLSVPMGAGMILTRHPSALARAFRTHSGYMPPAEKGAVDPYATTLQWSRRAIGLKVFMALAEAGGPGFGELLDHQAEMADLLRTRLGEVPWRIVNRTPLPLVCFTHERIERGEVGAGTVARRVNAAGKVWLSAVGLPGRPPALRACVTSYKTGPEDVEMLVAEVTRVLGS